MKNIKLLLAINIFWFSFVFPAHSSSLTSRILPNVLFQQDSHCYSHLDRNTYTSGFSDSDFSSSLSVDVDSGNLVLNTDQRALGDTNRILIRTKQDLKVKYVYESADQSQSLGWFLWNDQVKKFTEASGYTFTERPCTSDDDCDMGESCRWCSGTDCASSKVCTYERRILKDTGVDGTGGYNGVYDWFEKLYEKPGGTNDVYTFPKLVQPFPVYDPYPSYSWSKAKKLWVYDYYYLNGSSFSDGGTYPHISNYLEHLVDSGGGWLYLLADDDYDYESTVTCRSWDEGETGCLNYWWDPYWLSVVHWQWGSFVMPPVSDQVSNSDGVPDYDVNGDGTVNLLDREVNMGTFDSGTEIVFFLNSYYRNFHARHGSIGMKKYYNYYFDTVRTMSMPYFSKSALNPDYKSSGTFKRSIDLGCSYTTSGGLPGNTCGGVLGWLDQAALDRLDTAAYNYLSIPQPEKRNFYTIENGIRTHVLLGAPSSDPTRWILGFEQLYDGGAGGEMNYGNDYNDIVIVVERQNGGEIVSNLVVPEIPASELENTTINKVKLTKDDYIPIPPCTSEPETRIDYYISVNEDASGDPVWIMVEFPPGEDTVTVDLASLGYTGAKLRWKVEIISPNEQCKPEVRGLDIGYEALVGGDYSYSTPLPLANGMYKGTLETPSSSWTVTGGDTRNRGHYYFYELYDPAHPNTTNVKEIWDAGQVLANTNPDNRNIYTQNGMTKVSFEAGNDTWLLYEVLTNTQRNIKHNGEKVYDLNGDGNSNNEDSRQIIKWTRGWEYPIGSNPGSVPRRAWPLGAIHRSTGAIVVPPGVPAWNYGNGIDPAIKTAYNNWKNDSSRAERDAIALVGAQDGMLHAFYAGKFRWGDDPSTSQAEQRGYYEKSGASRDYGDGSELWAWIPPSQLNNLKNNYVKDYYPETHPWAQINGSIALTDLLYQNNWTTAAFYTHGAKHPYISAIDVTDPHNPQPMWDSDWTDNKYNGTYSPPAVIWVNSEKYGGKGKTWAVVTTSGMSDTYGDVSLYIIDADDGNTLPYGNVKFNVAGGSAGAQALGVWGSPVAIDYDRDGYTDRIYVADTNGRIWSHSLHGTNRNLCLVADVGKPIFTTPAVKVAQDLGTGQNVVALYFGTGDHPELNDPVNPNYKFYGIVDTSGIAECQPGEILFEHELPSDEKVWADAFISGDEVYVGTSTGDKADICDEDLSNPGHIYSFKLEADSDGLPIQTNAPVSAPGNTVSGIMVYDEHLFINSLGGDTKVLGGDKWNNDTSDGAAGARVEEMYWKED